MRVSDEDHAKLDAEWHQALDALRAAGLEHDADHPIAARYRAAGNAVNHANRSRDFFIFNRGTRVMRDADYQESSLRESALAIASGVCPLCEEYLANGEPIAQGLPYHEACLQDSTR